MNYQSARLNAKLGDLHVAFLAVFLSNSPELGLGTGGILHGIAHVFEASHQGLLLNSLVVQGSAVGLGLEDGVSQHEGSEHQRLHTVFFCHFLENSQL